MTRVHQEKGLTYVEPEVPENVVTAQICKKCGNLAVEGLCDHDPEGNMIVTEYFAEGTVPEDTCVCHVKYNICSASNSLASSRCPTSSVKEQVYRIRFLGKGSANDITYDTPFEVPAGLEDSVCHVHN